MVQANNSAFECVKLTEMPKSIYLFRVKWDVLLHRSICKSIEFVGGTTLLLNKHKLCCSLSKKYYNNGARWDLSHLNIKSFQFLTLNFTALNETFKRSKIGYNVRECPRRFFPFTAVAMLRPQNARKKVRVFVTTSKKQQFAAFFTSPFFASTICFQAFFSFYLIFRSAKNHRSEY